jgi:hypothetical protein
MINRSGSGSAAAPALSRDAAFVVHLATVAGEPSDQAHGRVEHVRSGRSARFDSLEDLLRFMRQTLSVIHSEEGKRS